MPLAPVDENGKVSDDHTADPESLSEGQIVYLHGFQPAVVHGVNDDGTVEIALQPTVVHDAGDISTHRGPTPSHLGPPPESEADRIEALEAQVAALVAALKTDSKSSAPTPPASSPPPVGTAS